MSEIVENRFIEEVKAIPRDNPDIDMKLVREWQRIAKILEKMPPPPESGTTEPLHLQPIPLRMFRR